MTDHESNAYILGTEQAEMIRLGLQHQVWAEEAKCGWANANFSHGDTILDLGCGPGFCTRDLGYLVGEGGKVIAIDRSALYIDFLKKIQSLDKTNIESHAVDFDDMVLEDNNLDGAYCRWALAWLSNPKEIVAKVYKALKPGGRFVVHEYYDWSTLQTEPQLENLAACIAGALKSFKSSEGEIDVGRFLPKIFVDLGYKIISTRPMQKLTRPAELTWSWPKTFFNIYFPKVAEMGFLTTDQVTKGLEEMDSLEQLPSATLLCPTLIEIVVEKPL